MDLNFKSLKSENLRWRSQMLDFIFLQKKREVFIAVHSLPKKVSIQTPWTIPGKQLRVFYFPPEKHSNGRNQIFSLEKKNHMWSTLIKNMYLIKFDQIIFWGPVRKNNKMFFPKKNRNGWQKNTTTKQNKKTYELLHCSCLSKLKSWPRKPLRFLRRDNKLLKLFVVHLCFWGQINHMYVAWKEQKRTSTCFWKAQIFAEECFPYGSLSTRHPCKSANILFWTTCNMCSLLESQIVKFENWS